MIKAPDKASAISEKRYDKMGSRLALIITKLSNGEKLSPKSLADEFNVNLRTIQRDLNERLSYLPIQKDRELYYLDRSALIDGEKLEYQDIQHFALLSGIGNLFPALDREFVKKLLKYKPDDPYVVKHGAFESVLDKKELFDALSVCVAESVPVSFRYNDKMRSVSPYKLINNSGIWYLLADDGKKLKTYVFSKIENLKYDPNKHFTPKKKRLKEIENSDAKWISSELTEVTLSLDAKAREYFFRKKHLQNIKIIEESDKHTIISTQITFDDEILHLVKYWIPYIRILSPQYLQDKLTKILKEYLATK